MSLKALNPDKPSVAVVGGGITGIATAHKLAKSGKFRVTVFEKAAEIGGLSGSEQWQGIHFDRYYHVILPQDLCTLKFVEDLGLDSNLSWKKSASGFFREGKLVPLSTVFDFIRFPFLSLWQKFRLGLGILYSARIKNPQKLDKLTAEQWLTRVFGRAVYQRIWEPLLRSKLGDAEAETSAAFIWSNIVRLYGAREAGSKQEKMGYVRGGYHTIWTAAKRDLDEWGAALRIADPVLSIRPAAEHGKLTVVSQKTRENFDGALVTVPCREALNIVDGCELGEAKQSLSRVKYLGVICVLMILKKSLSPYYVINLLDRDLPFTGIIETTNVHLPEDYDHFHLVYLPKYLPVHDPLFQSDDARIIDLFLENLRRVFPGLRTDEIVHSFVFRDKNVQPIRELNYLDSKLSARIPQRGVYIANSSMLYDSTINNNAGLALVDDVVQTIIEDLDDLDAG
jgi:protoporphyrinogen oxidase